MSSRVCDIYDTVIVKEKTTLFFLRRLEREALRQKRVDALQAETLISTADSYEGAANEVPQAESSELRKRNVEQREDWSYYTFYLNRVEMDILKQLYYLCGSLVIMQFRLSGKNLLHSNINLQSS